MRAHGVGAVRALLAALDGRRRVTPVTLVTVVVTVAAAAAARARGLEGCAEVLMRGAVVVWWW